MRYLYLITLMLLFCVNDGYYESYDRFIANYSRQFKKDNRLRPTDSLFYIAKIKNLYTKTSFDNLSIDKKRENLFSYLSRKRLKIVYPVALGLKSETIYFAQKGDLNHYKESFVVYKGDFSAYQPKYTLKMKALINLINEMHPCHVFIIDNIIDDKDIYWLITNDSVIVARYDESLNKFETFDAQYYLKRIAPDSVFSFSLRVKNDAF